MDPEKDKISNKIIGERRGEGETEVQIKSGERDYPQFDPEKIEASFLIAVKEHKEILGGVLSLFDVLKEELGKGDFSFEEMDQINRELVILSNRLKANVKELENLRSLYTHPFFQPDYYSTQGAIDEIEKVNKLNEKAQELVAGKRKQEERVKKENEILGTETVKARQEEEDSRTEAEKTIKEYSGFFSLGVPFSGGRKFKLGLLAEAKRKIKILDEFKALEDNAEDAICQNKWKPETEPIELGEQQLVASLIQKYSKIYSGKKALIERSKSSDADRKRVAANLLEECNRSYVDLKIRVSEKVPAFRADYEKQIEGVQEFEQFIEEKVFPLFSIDNKTEAAELEKKLPEETPEFIEKARERSFRNIREITRGFLAEAIRNGKPKERIITDLSSTLEKTKKDAFIGWNFNLGGLKTMVEAGKILPAESLPKNYQYAKAGIFMSSDEYYRIRKSVLDALGFSSKNPPVSTALGDEKERMGGPASNYGYCHFEFLPEDLKGKEVFTMGDSLNDIDIPEFLFRYRARDSKEISASSRSLILEHAVITKAIMRQAEKYGLRVGGAVSYIEGQVVDLSPKEASRLVVDVADGNWLLEQFKDEKAFKKYIKSFLPEVELIIKGEWPPRRPRKR